MEDSLVILSAFFGMSIPIIIAGLVYFFKKKFEHKQIMAAIEKGIPLPELKPSPKPAEGIWMKNLAAGIALLLVFCVCYFIFVDFFLNSRGFSMLTLLPLLIPLALGCGLVILAALQWKAGRRTRAIEKGVPSSELERSAQITSLSTGIGFIIFSLPSLFYFLEPLIRRDYVVSRHLTVFGILFAIGTAFLVRGILLRKALRQTED